MSPTHLLLDVFVLPYRQQDTFGVVVELPFLGAVGVVLDLVDSIRLIVVIIDHLAHHAVVRVILVGNPRLQARSVVFHLLLFPALCVIFSDMVQLFGTLHRSFPRFDRQVLTLFFLLGRLPEGD